MRLCTGSRRLTSLVETLKHNLHTAEVQLPKPYPTVSCSLSATWTSLSKATVTRQQTAPFPPFTPLQQTLRRCAVRHQIPTTTPTTSFIHFALRVKSHCLGGCRVATSPAASKCPQRQECGPPSNGESNRTSLDHRPRFRTSLRFGMF